MGDVMQLTGIILPESHDLRRKPTRPAHRITEEYRARYDNRTLVYDAFAVEGGAWLACPRALNLGVYLRDHLRVDGQPVRPRRHNWFRGDGFWLKGVQAGAELTVDVEGWHGKITVRPSAALRFKGRRALLAVNRNNPLFGLRDWARWHAYHHGCDAVVLFDNGSDAYSPEAARDALSAGLGPGGEVQVISAPFPFHPRDKNGRFDISPRFFQSTMLNIARLDFLSLAASVLNVDIDELVRPVPGSSVFQEAEGAVMGVVGFRGAWVHARSSPPAPHGVHHLQAAPDDSRNPKWCAVPGRRLARHYWATHRICEPVFPLAIRRDLGYWHFRQMTTSWKHARATQHSGLTTVVQLAEALAAAGLTKEGDA